MGMKIITEEAADRILDDREMEVGSLCVVRFNFTPPGYFVKPSWVTVTEDRLLYIVRYDSGILSINPYGVGIYESSCSPWRFFENPWKEDSDIWEASHLGY